MAFRRQRRSGSICGGASIAKKRASPVSCIYHVMPREIAKSSPTLNAKPLNCVRKTPLPSWASQSSYACALR
jgi:hypothetical protein